MGTLHRGKLAIHFTAAKVSTMVKLFKMSLVEYDVLRLAFGLVKKPVSEPQDREIRDKGKQPMSVADVQPRIPTGSHSLAISSGVVQPIEPGITMGVSPYTRILASNARDDESDLVVEPQDHGDPSLRPSATSLPLCTCATQSAQPLSVSPSRLSPTSRHGQRLVQPLNGSTTRPFKQGDAVVGPQARSSWVLQPTGMSNYSRVQDNIDYVADDLKRKVEADDNEMIC
ncbi:hypothetical protein WN944_001782 [Citrus x changshan-huyou]|uniref:Uncharacterized protein n=1 Tax=Citrus x changshan-huyou TaxID=2935761 RepID=A0AAP0MKE8_9ROSI